MKPLKALVVEDSEVDEELLLRQLTKADYDVQSIRVQTAADMAKALAEREWDIILSDYAMPGFTGLDALRVLKESGRDIPLIIISGTIGEDVAVEAMRVGVDDYLMKGNLTRLAPAIERELENAASRQSQKRAEEYLRRSEENLATAQRIAHLGSWETDLVNNRLFWSDEVYRIFGVSKDDFGATLESFISFIHPEDRQSVQANADAALSQNAPYNIEHRIVRPDGEIRVVCETGEVTFDESGEAIRFVGTVQDITERNAAETEMRLMKSAVDSIVEGIVISDAQKPDYPIIYTNAAFKNLTGYAWEEIKSQNCRFLQGAETNPRTVDEIGKAIGKAATFRGEILNYHKNGEPFWNELKISPVFDRTGRLTNFVGVQQNVSERKKSEETLRESEERYRIVAESASDVIITINENSSISFANSAAEKVLGYKPEELIGKQLGIIIPERHHAAHKDGMRRYMQTGERRIPWNGIEISALRRDGREIQIEISFGEYHENNTRLFTGIIRDITERKQTEKALREAEDKYRTLVESSPAIVYLTEPHPPFSPIYVSPNVTRFGYSTEEWLNRPDMWVSLIHQDDRARVLRATKDAMERAIETDLEYRIVARDDTISWLHDKGRFVFDEHGNKTGWQGIMLDITRTKELEEQLRQSQKLESVGLLAGGIAHDFNNMLTAINGYSDLTLRRLKPDNPLRHNIEEIKKAGQRSADLTHQLLAFSRRQILQPLVLDLNEVIGETIKMLQRLIGEDIQLTTILNPKVGRVKVDPGQFSQIIMNLTVNARDAMPQGGKLTIATSNVFLEPDYTRRHTGVLPGAYVLLTFSDSGTGMSAETKEHIFEPFFTTKAIGQGTGLGLATVYGIVRQSGGNIEVDSEQGLGTTFKVYLPRVAEQPGAEKIKETSAELPKGTETILLVEDEEMVRNLTRQILEECGYTIIEARDGLEALKICETEEYKFDLLVTDVIMPQMGGRQLAEIFKSKLPEMRILFTSGYTDDAVVRRGVIETNTNFIQKPYSPIGLANKIREILNNS